MLCGMNNRCSKFRTNSKKLQLGSSRVKLWWCLSTQRERRARASQGSRVNLCQALSSPCTQKLHPQLASGNLWQPLANRLPLLECQVRGVCHANTNLARHKPHWNGELVPKYWCVFHSTIFMAHNYYHWQEQQVIPLAEDCNESDFFIAMLNCCQGSL